MHTEASLLKKIYVPFGAHCVHFLPMVKFRGEAASIFDLNQRSREGPNIGRKNTHLKSNPGRDEMFFDPMLNISSLTGLGSCTSSFLPTSCPYGTAETQAGTALKAPGNFDWQTACKTMKLATLNTRRGPDRDQMLEKQFIQRRIP